MGEPSRKLRILLTHFIFLQVSNTSNFLFLSNPGKGLSCGGKVLSAP